MRYCGQDYFIKGRMSTGYAILMDIAGNKVDLKPIPKFDKMRESECSKIMDDDAKNHAKFLILFHLIFVCKYRKKLLILYGEETKQVFEEIPSRSDFSFETWGVDQDHIHCLVKSELRISPLAIVRRLKQESTIRLWKAHERALKKQFWKGRTFWSDGYFCCTIGNASQETSRHYIESHG